VYKLYSVGDKTESCGTPAFISLSIDILPSTKTLNFLSERDELIRLIRLDENSILNNLYSKPGCHKVSKAFSIQEYRSCRHVIVQIKIYMVC
jgi:hypothetical protein